LLGSGGSRLSVLSAGGGIDLRRRAAAQLLLTRDAVWLASTVRLAVAPDRCSAHRASAGRKSQTVGGFGAGFGRGTLRLGRAELGTGQWPRVDPASSARLLDRDHLRDGSGGHDWRRWVSRATRYKHGTEHNGTDNAEHRQINAEQQHSVYPERYTAFA